jgi:hypothetical protein
MIMREQRALIIVAAAFASLLLSGLARGDLIPPDQGDCTGKKAGDSCKVSPGTTLTGVCVSSTTCPARLPDGGIVTVSCLLCKLSTGDGGPKPSTDGAVKPTVDSGTKPPATKDESGCAVGGVSVTRVFGPWLLALSVSALLFLARRRRR